MGTRLIILINHYSLTFFIIMFGVEVKLWLVHLTKVVAINGIVNPFRSWCS
jgi:hypothetical protein